MTDLVERLRAPSHHFKALMLEATDEIERLRAALIDIEELVEGYADVDDGQPNLAMRVLVVARTALRREP